MAPVRLISLEKQFVERIDWEKIDWKDKGLINLPYVIGYYFGAKTDKMSIAKTYEDENTMIVTLQIPKSDYKNKSFQNLLKCPELPVQDEYYYRDWAVHMVMAGDNEKTVLFSHGRITLDVKDNSKADYVTVEIVIKQKEDMLRGVVFGLELDETYKEAWEKVMNPVGLNVVVPVVAASNGVVLTGIKNAKEITEEEDFYVEEDSKDFALLNTVTEFIIYLGKGSQWYGHAEISVDGIIYSYGKYVDMDGDGKLDDDGILVKTKRNQYLRELNLTREFTVYGMNFTQEEAMKIIEFYGKIISNSTIAVDRSTKAGYTKILYDPKNGKYDIYGIIGPNCVTVMMDAILYATNNNSERGRYRPGPYGYAFKTSQYFPPDLKNYLDEAYKRGASIIKYKKYYNVGDMHEGDKVLLA